MTSDPDPLRLTQAEFYDAVESEVVALTRRLPVPAVKRLAEEVVVRLAGRERRAELAQIRSLAGTDPVVEFCDALLSSERDAALRLVEADLRAGANYDTICAGRLTPAARKLGELWDQDRASYTHVTLATSRIYAILRWLAPPHPANPTHRRALFASTPGDRHLLGVTMAAEACQERGWDIELCLEAEHDELVTRIETADCAIVGVSAGSLRSLVPLARLIVAIRVVRPGLPIIVSGNIVGLAPDIAGLSGADAAVSTLESALAEMDRLTLRP